ncbi:MAG: hypothetical protein ACT4TC_15585 [Myxococcaceae bacterium]
MLLLITALVLTADGGAAQTPRERAMDLNTQGFRLYKAKKFPEALELFRQATQADEAHAMSHYNYAATLSVLRQQKRVCEFMAIRPAIVTELTRAVELDATRKRRMVSDADFTAVRDTVGYQKLAGVDPSRPAGFKTLLERVTWWSSGQGAYGSLLQLDLQRNGKLLLKRRVVTDDGVREEKETGTWRTDGTTVFVKTAAGEVKGTLSPEGALELPEPMGRLFDFPSECDA